MERQLNATNRNLIIWNQSETTDPDFTKPYKGKGGFSGTAINSMYLTKLATKIFGPVGYGWGYNIVEERLDVGAPIGTYQDSGEIIYQVIHTIRLELWYKHEDEKCVVSHYGHTDFIYADKFGIKTESECSKKSLTDALGKCLSMLGFSADIFLKLFDDQDYVREAAEKAALEKTDNKLDLMAKILADYEREKLADLELIKTAQNLNELKLFWIRLSRRMKRRNDDAGLVMAERLVNERKKFLEENTQP